MQAPSAAGTLPEPTGPNMTLHSIRRTLQSAPCRARSGIATLVTAGFLLGPALLSAQEHPGVPGPVVGAGWLADNLGAPGLVILQTGGSQEAFAEAHIPGARYLDLGAVSYSRGEMTDPDHVMLDVPADVEVVRAALESVGLSDASTVVVTYEGARRVTSATRLLWTLEFMGLGGRSALLDGGNEGWLAAGGAMESGTEPAVPAGALTTGPLEDRRVDQDWVGASLSARGIAIVDGRRPEAYSGERPEFPGRAGHIPGAGSLPIEELFGEDGLLRSREELVDLLARAGVEEGDTVVAYCHIGLRATAVVLAARVAGYRAVLYDGSMNEWARNPERPLEAGGGNR